MATRIHDGVDALREVHECPGCLPRDREIQRLREQCATSQKGDGKGRIGWWCLLAAGLCGLALSPHLCLLLVGIIEAADLSNGVLRTVIEGAVYAVPIAQFSVIGSVVVLHWRPRWQRFSIALGVAGFFALLAVGPNFLRASDFLETLYVEYAPLLPATTVISACPVLFMRALLRWTIGMRGKAIHPRALTLSSSLILIALCGLATASLRWTDTSSMGEMATAELALVFLMYAGAPAVTTGGLFAILLPTILQRDRRSWTTWALRLLMIVAVAAAIPPLLCLAVVTPASTGGLLGDGIDPYSFAYHSFAYGIGAATTAILVGAASFSWMRFLGYFLSSRMNTAVETA